MSLALTVPLTLLPAASGCAELGHGGNAGTGTAATSATAATVVPAATATAVPTATATAGTTAGTTAASGAAGAVRVEAAAGVSPEAASGIRADVAAAVAHVQAIWPGGWADRVEVTVVAGARALAQAAGSPELAGGHHGGIAAVAVVGVGGTGASRPPGSPAGRLVVDAEVYERLSRPGARLVARHEVAHLASAAATPADMPVWLVEGFADAVGHAAGPGEDPGPEPAGLAPELAAEVAAGRLPADLPGDAAFAGADGRLPQAYQQAWLACRMIADEVGMSGLVRLYRAVGTGPGPGDAADRLGAGLADVLGTTYPQFVSRWRDYLRLHLHLRLRLPPRTPQPAAPS